jgi:hypothetical protein
MSCLSKFAKPDQAAEQKKIVADKQTDEEAIWMKAKLISGTVEDQSFSPFKPVKKLLKLTLSGDNYEKIELLCMRGDNVKFSVLMMYDALRWMCDQAERGEVTQIGPMLVWIGYRYCIVDPKGLLQFAVIVGQNKAATFAMALSDFHKFVDGTL